MSGAPWIGFDLDGTLALDVIWKGHKYIGAPIAIMVDRVKHALAAGYEVRIVTARVSDPDTADEARAAIEMWCETHFGQRLVVTCCKDYDMVQLWDDRAIGVQKNTGRLK